MEYSAILSLPHQKPADKVEVTCCLGSTQCSCSDCKMEAAFGGFTVLDFPAKCEPAKRFKSPSPKIASLGDGHRCKKFPCPVCHPGRSQRGDLSNTAVVTPQMLELHGHGAVQLHAGLLFFGDGGHTCRQFPCPICNRVRFASLEVEVGC